MEMDKKLNVQKKVLRALFTPIHVHRPRNGTVVTALEKKWEY